MSETADSADSAEMTKAMMRLAQAQCPDEEIASRIAMDFPNVMEDDVLAILTDDDSPWKPLVATWRRAGIAQLRHEMWSMGTKQINTKEGALMATILGKHYCGIGDDKMSRKTKKALEEARRHPQRVIARIEARQKGRPNIGVLGVLPPLEEEEG